MPQLDQVTYFSQYFWLVIFLFTYYAIVVKSFLPKYSRILKVRTKKIRAANSTEDSLSNRVALIPQNRDTLLVNSLIQSRVQITQSYQTTQQRIESRLRELEQRVFHNANQNYLTNLAEFGLGLHVISNDVAFPERASTSTQQWYDVGVITRLISTKSTTTTNRR